MSGDAFLLLRSFSVEIVGAARGSPVAHRTTSRKLQRETIIWYRSNVLQVYLLQNSNLEGLFYNAFG